MQKIVPWQKYESLYGQKLKEFFFTVMPVISFEINIKNQSFEK